jgi:hypothetical protein
MQARVKPGYLQELRPEKLTSNPSRSATVTRDKQQGTLLAGAAGLGSGQVASETRAAARPSRQSSDGSDAKLAQWPCSWTALRSTSRTASGSKERD